MTNERPFLRRNVVIGGQTVNKSVRLDLSSYRFKSYREILSNGYKKLKYLNKDGKEESQLDATIMVY